MQTIHQSFKKHNMTRFLPILIVMFSLFFSACEGGLCSASKNGLTDADSDCFADSSDNCPLIYNPDQFDGDSDGQGEACDSDDTTTAEALRKDPDYELAYAWGDYNQPTDETSTKALTTKSSSQSCQFYLIGCEGTFLGFLSNDIDLLDSVIDPSSPFGNLNSDYAILSSSGFYGRSQSICSPFNQQASTPPALFCLANTDQHSLVGYLTTNSNIASGQDTCSFLNALGINSKNCF